MREVDAFKYAFSTQLNSTDNYGRRCLTPLSPYHIIIYYHCSEIVRNHQSHNTV